MLLYWAVKCEWLDLANKAPSHHDQHLLRCLWRRSSAATAQYLRSKTKPSPVFGGLSTVRTTHGLNVLLQYKTKYSPGPSDPNAPLVGSATLIPPLLATATGNVLELGPGSGAQVQYFKAASNAQRIYGAEPCVPLHDDLQANARRHGLGDKYVIIEAGAEKETLVPGLAKAGLLNDKSPEHGVFDTIVCVRVLCSVQNLEKTAETVYQLLKPGGKLLVCEHTVNPWWTRQGSFVGRFFQTLYSLLGWTFFVGNCHLTRDIQQAVVGAADPYGGWERVDLSNNFGWSVLPYVAGTLVKRRK